MLPDYPSTKAKLMQRYLRIFEQAVEARTLPVPWVVQHEGDQSRLVREDGSEEKSASEPKQVEIKIDKEGFGELTVGDIDHKYGTAAQQMAGQLMGSFFRAVDQATEEAGTAIDASGRPLTADLFLELLDRVQLGFDRAGNLVPPTIVLHPDAWDAVKDEVAGWEDDQDFKREYERLIERKREEWREGESRRKLVD